MICALNFVSYLYKPRLAQQVSSVHHLDHYVIFVPQYLDISVCASIATFSLHRCTKLIFISICGNSVHIVYQGWPMLPIGYICQGLQLDYTINAHQLKALEKLASGEDVFCLLPTGFGKSTIFALFPLLKDKVCNRISFSVGPLQFLFFYFFFFFFDICFLHVTIILALNTTSYIHHENISILHSIAIFMLCRMTVQRDTLLLLCLHCVPL